MKFLVLFFIFKKRNEVRERKQIPIITDFSFVKKEDADCSIRRVGFYAGRIEDINVSESSHYFVRWNTAEAKEKYLKLKFSFDNIVGPRSISKTEILRKYYEAYK